MANLDSVLKSKDVTLPTKVHMVKATVFPVVMSGCKSWAIKKAEHRRTDAFQTAVLEKRVPWSSRSNQSILKEINSKYSLEAKLQYFGHLMRRADLLVGKVEGRRGRGRQRMRLSNGITDSITWTWANPRRWWETGISGVLQSMGSWRAGTNWQPNGNIPFLWQL